MGKGAQVKMGKGAQLGKITQGQKWERNHNCQGESGKRIAWGKWKLEHGERWERAPNEDSLGE